MCVCVCALKHIPCSQSILCTFPLIPAGLEHPSWEAKGFSVILPYKKKRKTNNGSGPVNEIHKLGLFVWVPFEPDSW